MLIVTNVGDTLVTFEDELIFTGAAEVFQVAFAIGVAEAGERLGLTDPAHITAFVNANTGQLVIRARPAEPQADPPIPAVEFIRISSVDITNTLGFPETKMTKDSSNSVAGVHEVGHAVIDQDADTYHSEHTLNAGCAAHSAAVHFPTFCPKHVRAFRRQIAKFWVNEHNKPVEFD